MSYLIDQMIIYILLAVIVAVLIDIIVVEGRNDAVMIYMVILGAFTGWISFMIFVFATGGLAQFDIWAILPIILPTLVSIWVLIKFADVKVMFRRPRWKVGKYTSLVATLVLVVMLGSFAVLTIIPIDVGGTSIRETQTYDISGRLVTGNQRISSSVAKIASKDIQSSSILIDAHVSCVHFPVISENPEEEQYYNFEVTFSTSSSGGDWSKPFIKIWFFADVDGSGGLNSGDAYISDYYYKFPTTVAGKLRCNLMWSGGSPFNQLNILNFDGTLGALPMIYSDISQWKDDNGQTFYNTPENYVSPNDMLSWDYNDASNVVTLKESITSWTEITAGSSMPAIRGKIYFPVDSAGEYGVVYQAFDAGITPDPYDPGITPLAQKVDMFTVDPPGGNGGNGGGYPDVTITTSSWVTGLALGGLTLLGSIVAIIKGPKLLLK